MGFIFINIGNIVQKDFGKGNEYIATDGIRIKFCLNPLDLKL